MLAVNLVGLLKGVRKVGPNRWSARCPCPDHDDKNASLSVRETDTGHILLHCFAGCQFVDVLGALGLRPADVMPPREAIGKERRVERAVRWEADLVLHALAHEARIVHLYAARLKEGKGLSAADYERLTLVVSRITNALSYTRALETDELKSIRRGEFK